MTINFHNQELCCTGVLKREWFWLSTCRTNVTFQGITPDLAGNSGLQCTVGGCNQCAIVNHPPQDWQGEKGLVGADSVEKFGIQPMSDAAFYLCGPPPMIQSLLDQLRDKGVPRNSIHFELFSFQHG
ncbi:MAG: hypothetical protein GF398_02670 [Chitinivibrionales bacterium]|nr:hypothetical protein [Chitinivibrionales bacterium]